ncbi:hypothetical protein Tco_0837058 [Tanacetum coccineum]
MGALLPDNGAVICVSRHNEVAGVSLGFPANLEPSFGNTRMDKFDVEDKPETLETVDLGDLLGEVEQKILKRQIKQVEEDEQTLADLESATPQCNDGFKMFKQTGYTLGCGSGRVEPMGVEIRRRREEELMVDFGCRVKERMLDQLENKEVVVVEKEDDIDANLFMEVFYSVTFVINVSRLVLILVVENVLFLFDSGYNNWRLSAQRFLMNAKLQDEGLLWVRRTNVDTNDEVLLDIGRPLCRELELISFQTVSKGFLEECGERGGHFEMTTILAQIVDEMYKVASISLSPSVTKEDALEYETQLSN